MSCVTGSLEVRRFSVGVSVDEANLRSAVSDLSDAELAEFIRLLREHGFLPAETRPEPPDAFQKEFPKEF